MSPIPHLPAPGEWPTRWETCVACAGTGKEADFDESYIVGQAFPRRHVLRFGPCPYCAGSGGHMRYHPLDPRHPNNAEAPMTAPADPRPPERAVGARCPDCGLVQPDATHDSADECIRALRAAYEMRGKFLSFVKDREAKAQVAREDAERERAEWQRWALRDAAELTAISAAIGTVEFMDPPDGGDVSLAEQVGRMAAALRAAPDPGAVGREGPWCYDCGLPYADAGFQDLVVSHDVWAKITPTGHEGGLLCPTCMCRRAHGAGVEAPAVFRSGPFCVEG